MITEDYVSFETAKLLKEKGFDENTPVNYFVGDDKPRGCVVGEMIYHKRLEEDTHLIACPTLQMAMKWLRELLHLEIYLEHDTIQENNNWWYQIGKYTKGFINIEHESSSDYATYEEACEAAIKYCLENLI